MIQYQKGISLTELMVALALGLTLSLATMMLFVNNNQTYRFHAALSRIQENGRFALEILTNNIRMAGAMGCSSATTMVNVLNNCGKWDQSDWWKNLGPGSLLGYDGSQDFSEFSFSSGNRTKETDAIISLGSGGGYFITASSPTSSPPTFTLNQSSQSNGESLKSGSLVIVCNTQNATLFQITAVNHSSPFTILHAASANHCSASASGVSPGNCTQNLFPGSGLTPTACITAPATAPPAPSVTGGVPDSYIPGQSILVDYVPTAFYIKKSASGATQSLYQKRLQVTNTGKASMITEELVEGVENMQIFYGEDSNGDRIIDQYVDASASPDWKNVLSIRIFLLITSQDENNLVEQPQIYFFPNDTGDSNIIARMVTAKDRRLYQTFSTTIALRNRLP
ncbi:type IV pilus assembly protein PilW [Gammaproteobacteria bacterium]